MGGLNNWIDVIVVVLVALALLRGFLRGFIRELFGLAGVIVAVVAGLYWYQELADYAIEMLSMVPWQAQVLAFGAIALAVGLLTAFFTAVWTRIIRVTPFALLDRVAGALFSVGKVLILLLIAVSLVSSFGIPPVQVYLDQSMAVEQLLQLRPLVYRFAEEWWPQSWNRPLWLFPEPQIP